MCRDQEERGSRVLSDPDLDFLLRNMGSSPWLLDGGVPTAACHSAFDASNATTV